MRQQEDISGIESKMRDFGKQQEKIHNKVALVIVGSFVTSILAIISIIFSSHLFSDLKEVKKNLDELKQQNSQDKKKSTPPKNSPSQTSPTSRPSQSPVKPKTQKQNNGAETR